MAQEARRPSRWWLAWLVVLLVLDLVSPFGSALGILVLDDPGRTDAAYPYVEAFPAAITLLALYLWVRFKEGRSFATVGFRPGRGAVLVVWGFAIGAALMTVGVLVGLGAGVYENGRSSHIVAGSGALLAVVPLMMLLLLQATAQEVVTRGYLLPMTARQLPAWVAVVSTAVLVGTRETLNPLTLLNAVLYAVFASLVALQQGSLWLVIGIQAGWALFRDNVFGLSVVGITQPTSVFTVGPAPDTSTLLSGGVFGPECGLIATAVLAVAAVAAYVRLRRTTRPPARLAPVAAPTEPAPRKEPTNVANGV